MSAVACCSGIALPAAGGRESGGSTVNLFTFEGHMPFLVGIVLSLVVAVMARRVGFDRDRAFYPTVVMVVASYYVLFAAMGGSTEALIAELLAMMVFVAVAVLGFRSSRWIVVAALAGHGVFDALHGHIIANAGVPVWWPLFCSAYDIGAAAWLAWRLMLTHQPVTRGDLAQLATRL